MIYLIELHLDSSYHGDFEIVGTGIIPDRKFRMQSMQVTAMTLSCCLDQRRIAQYWHPIYRTIKMQMKISIDVGYIVHGINLTFFWPQNDYNTNLQVDF